jgi:hypothetical protein
MTSVKSLQKQLLAAVAMVLVAAIAMSSATYAWFVNNATVTATDVSVKASTAYSLLISHKNGDDAAWGTTTKLETTVQELTPVSTIGEVATTTTAVTLSAKDGETPAVGIGDGKTIAAGDVRFVTNTEWKDNYVTKVSEVSRNSGYFYSDTFYLKAAQDGNIYLDSTGIGIVWAKYDTSKTSKFADAELISLADFAALKEIDTTSLTTDTTPTKAAAEAYNEKLTSAQALLKTLRIGLLVTQGTDTKTQVWHEYQLDASAINTDNRAYTTKNSTAKADGLANAVSLGTSTVTNAEPTVDSIKNPSNITITGNTIETFAVEGSQTGVVTVTGTTKDVIAAATTNEEIQVDVYIWMEGCDQDTVAANITSFAGTGVTGLQLGFCLGKASTTT